MKKPIAIEKFANNGTSLLDHLRAAVRPDGQLLLDLNWKIGEDRQWYATVCIGSLGNFRELHALLGEFIQEVEADGS